MVGSWEGVISTCEDRARGVISWCEGGWTGWVGAVMAGWLAGWRGVGVLAAFTTTKKTDGEKRVKDALTLD